MSLDLAKLNNVKKGADGGVKAGCPACAALGQDNRKEHLYIYPDGRFGCAKYRGDRAHRAVIAKLVGDGRTVKASSHIVIKPFLYPESTKKADSGTTGTPFYNLRALAKRIIVSSIDRLGIRPLGEIGLQKAVPDVPEIYKSLTDNDEREIEVVPAEIVDQIREDCDVGVWVRGLEEAFDARIVGAVWDCEVYGDMETEAK
jgi:hypothetical protein